VTGAVQSRVSPDSVLRVRYVLPFVVALMVLGALARSLTVGVAVPLIGVVAVALVLLDQLAPKLRGTSASVPGEGGAPALGTD
jgi:hypothetical protein